MKTRTIAKTGLGIGAALLVLTVGPGSVAIAASDDRGASVPCSGSGGGAAGLVAAIKTANSSGGGTIKLARRCTYKIATADNVNPIPMIGGANGLPVITTKITINGRDTTIAGNGVGFRIFEVDGPGGNLTLQDLTLRGGASPAGGAIFNIEGAVTLNDSQITGNRAALGGGGIASGVVDPNHLGPIGTLTLNHSKVNNNTVAGVPGMGGGGGGILNRAGTATLNFSQVNGNISAGGGGGIASGGGGTPGSGSTLILKFSQVNNNTSNGGNMSGAGGIANGGVATITHSEVNNNKAPAGAGGGILNHGTMTINLSEVNGNHAPNNGVNDGIGGGIANLNFGAFAGAGGVLTINRSEVNDNTASGIGGGIIEAGFNPDGTFAPGAPLALNHSEVTDNTSGSGGGIWAPAGSPVTLKHTSVRENTPDNCFPPGSIAGCSG
jgi:hypothetical protein